MSSVRAHRVSFSYSDAVAILDDLELHLPSGWTGLVGDNGSGKTTLLRLIAGELRPTSGHLQLEPPESRVVLCPQLVEESADAISSFAWAADSLASRLRGQLRLRAEALERWPTLSPGERKRWQIGAALWQEPEVLLLDEPTNHLDAEARGLLLESLAEYRGVGVVVSHDRALLNALTQRTVRFHRGEARTWPGPYSQARQDWEAEEAAQVGERRKLQSQQRRLAAQLADARRERDSAEAMRSTRKRMRSKSDSDARTLVAKTKADWGEATLSRSVELSRRKVEKADAQLAAAPMEKAKGRSLFVEYVPAPMPRLFALDALELRAGDERLLGEVHLVVGRTSRIRIAGRNGAGKTTLIGALLASGHLPADRVLLVPQELSQEESAGLLDQVRALAPEVRGRVLSLVAALGTDPERLLRSEAPSPGEARKLLMALGLGRYAWVAVLDEPTNHLDLPSVERLEAALADFPGALVLVTHDDEFASRLVTETWTLRDGSVVRT